MKVLSTERVQDGVERLIFAAGPHALAEVQGRERALLDVAELLGAPLERVREAASNTVETVKRLRHEIEGLRRTASMLTAERLLEKAERVDDTVVVIESVVEGADFIIEVGNALTRQEGKPVVAVMHSEVEPRIVVAASEAAVMRGFHAGELASEVAKIIGGGGGGEPHFGQGGGGDVEKFKAERKRIMKAVEEQLK